MKIKLPLSLSSEPARKKVKVRYYEKKGKGPWKKKFKNYYGKFRQAKLDRKVKDDN